MQKPAGNMKSPVWKYYTADNEQRTCTCNRCTQTYTATHSGGKNKWSYPLNRMARHLVEDHPKEFYSTASERDFITSANVFLIKFVIITSTIRTTISY